MSTGVVDHARRAALGTLIAGGLGYALFGPRRAAKAPRGRVILNYWEKWTGLEAKAMTDVIARFNDSQDRIWVNYFSQAAIEQKALVAIAGGDPPDIVGLWNFMLPWYLEMDGILPLDELDAQYGAEIERTFADRYGDRNHRLSPDLYKPVLWDMCRWNGVVAGLPNTCSTMGLYYDRDLFRSVGLDPDNPPKTIPELDEASDRLSIRAGSTMKRTGFTHREPGWWNWIWGYYFGGTLLDEQGNPTADAPENVRAYEWVQSYPERYGVGRLTTFQSGFGGYSSAQQAFLVGKVAMCYQGSFLANVVESYKPDLDYGAAPFPVLPELYDPEQPVGLIECDALCIPRGCKHPREAYEFLMYTQRQPEAEHLALVHAKPSPMAKVSPAFEAAHPNRYIGVFDALAASERAFPKPPTPVWPEYEREFNVAIEPIWRMTRTPADVLAGVDQRATVALERFRARQTRRAGA